MRKPMSAEKPLLVASAAIAMCEQVLLIERKRSMLLDIIAENRGFTEMERIEFCGLEAEMQAHSSTFAISLAKLRRE